MINISQFFAHVLYETVFYTIVVNSHVEENEQIFLILIFYFEIVAGRKIKEKTKGKSSITPYPSIRNEYDFIKNMRATENV